MWSGVVQTDKTAPGRLVPIDWDATGRIIEQVIASDLDPTHLGSPLVIGADEVSRRKGHSYVTLLSNHDTSKFVLGNGGNERATHDCFFGELGEERSAVITAVSMDMGPSLISPPASRVTPPRR